MLLVVARMTQAHEVAVCKSKFWMICIMLDVMHLGSLGPFAVPLAILALVFVTAKNVFSFLPPCF
jgi:hypothetical protein